MHRAYCINMGDGTYLHSFTDLGYNVVKELSMATRFADKDYCDQMCTRLFRSGIKGTYKFEV